MSSHRLVETHPFFDERTACIEGARSPQSNRAAEPTFAAKEREEAVLIQASLAHAHLIASLQLTRHGQTKVEKVGPNIGNLGKGRRSGLAVKEALRRHA